MKKILKYILIVIILLLVLLFFILPSILDKTSNKITVRVPKTPSNNAKELHAKLWISDLHADALLWNRNLLKRNEHGHVDMPRLIEGNVALQVFSIVSKSPFGLNFERNDDKSDMITLVAIVQRWPIRSWFSLKERALYQADKLHRFVAKSDGKLSIIKSRSDLTEYVARRKSEREITAGLLGIEGAQVLEGELSNVQELFDAGFRMMAPTHFFDNKVSGSAHGLEKSGLTELGREMIKLMEQLGMIVDLAHASPTTIDDVLEMAAKPIIVSHTGVKGTCDNLRNLSDKHIQGIAETGGVIGIAYFAQATCGEDIESIVKAIQFVVNLVGVEHVALGSDFDGAVETPFDTAGLIELTDALLNAGFSENEIELIMGGNVRRLLLEILPE